MDGWPRAGHMYRCRNSLFTLSTFLLLAARRTASRAGLVPCLTRSRDGLCERQRGGLLLLRSEKCVSQNHSMTCSGPVHCMRTWLARRIPEDDDTFPSGTEPSRPTRGGVGSGVAVFCPSLPFALSFASLCWLLDSSARPSSAPCPRRARIKGDAAHRLHHHLDHDSGPRSTLSLGAHVRARCAAAEP